MDIRHFVIILCSHPANGYTIKCGFIGFMLFRCLSCLGAIICDINTLGFVSVPMHAETVMLWWNGVQTLTRRP